MAEDEERSDRDELVRLQRLLLPASLPSIGCTEAAAGYRAHNHAFELGGDWYDLIDRPDDRVVAVIGDVVGHGAEQIGVMGQLRAAANAFARVCDTPAEILTMLERFAVELPGADMTTAQVLMLDGTERIGIASAGHPPPLVVRHDGSVDVVEIEIRPPLGLYRTASPQSFPAEVGDLIVLYTDGVVERPGSLIDDGIGELAAFVSARRSAPVPDIVDATLAHFGRTASDDLALLVLRPVHERSDRYRLQRKQPVDIRIVA